MSGSLGRVGAAGPTAERALLVRAPGPRARQAFEVIRRAVGRSTCGRLNRIACTAEAGE